MQIGMRTLSIERAGFKFSICRLSERTPWRMWFVPMQYISDCDIGLNNQNHKGGQHNHPIVGLHRARVVNKE